MPLDLGSDDSVKFPQPQFLTLNSWRKGVITLVDKSRLPNDALEEADNLYLVEDGQPTVRPGVSWFGTAPGAVSAPSASLSPSASRSPSASASGSPSSSASPSASLSPSSSASRSISPSASSSPSASRSPSASISPSASGSKSTSPSASTSPSSSVSSSVSPSPSAGNWPQIDGFDYFDFSGVIHLVAVAGGTVYRSLDDAQTWTACTGANLTIGATTYFEQNGGFLYITNGTDPITRYDGSTNLLQYGTLTTPAAATITPTGLSGSNFKVYYKISAVNEIGFSAASVNVEQDVSLSRDGWDATTNYLTLSLPDAQSGQTRYDIYFSIDDLNYFYLDSVAAVTGQTGITYKDDGSAIQIPSTTQPLDNTTQGPLVEELTNIGDRMYGVRDHNNRYRISFTGTGNFSGAFSNAYDGGYLDWQPGGKYIPVSVQDYRDGKGTPLATIWCKSADGQGCILQLSLGTLTVGDITITVPSAYRLPGSRGTPAPNSVVNVLNDFMFYNSQGFYNLGSRAQFLNLLSTDESSANIRPTVRQISTAAESSIASIYFNDGTGSRVYFSVPLGSTENSQTMIYDTDRKAWMPQAFSIGFSKFLHYTDTTNSRRLLALKPGDVQLSEINPNTQGDYGVAFETSLLTGLYSTSKDRFEFQYTEEAEIELSNPQGSINVELIGIERSKGFSSQATSTISDTGTTVTTGWNTAFWDTLEWDDTSSVATPLSESSVKRYLLMQAELNAIQWHLTTNTIDANYILRTLQTWGSDTQAGHPPSWLLH